MANICETIIKIVDDDTSKFESLCSMLGEGSFELSYLKSKFDIHDDLSVRGYVHDVTLSPDRKTLIIFQEDAWSPNVRIWQKILEKLNITDQHLNVTGIEPGNGIFESTDLNFIGLYYMDFYEDENDKLNEFIICKGKQKYDDFGLPVFSENEILEITKSDTIEQSIDVLKGHHVYMNQIQEVTLSDFVQ